MASSPEAKVRVTRGQKRNFSFESHPTSSNAAAAAKAISGEGDNFDIASLVNEIERTVENDAGGPTHEFAEDAYSDQVCVYEFLLPVGLYV